ncbi:hypothetical protein SAMN05660831_00198 [Thiohalospira halophila DSM 15071]|uniref:Uncharacterized protein n=1 Tax=Thiohalospira halophila DSM 15071 TaxID=1123397 RepID=A0A1I1NCH2_9GAMM|nr:hypothetical protein [Thiohalospira halophila]SFC94942.1 hypothetical protein SAMN05660831_00198 [Thiohalospira halophila DSM 15071]
MADQHSGNHSGNEVQLGAQGRVMSPAEQRLQDRFRSIPEDVNLVQELLDERDEEAGREAAED